MIKKLTSLIFLLSATCAWAVNSPITGLVQANCSIYTTTGGQYGNPSPWKLSTASADGGVDAIIRVDIAAADYYYTKFTHPNNFSSAPSLTDGVDVDGQYGCKFTLSCWNVSLRSGKGSCL